MPSHYSYNPGIKIPGGPKNEPLNMAEFDAYRLSCGGIIYYPKAKSNGN